MLPTLIASISLVLSSLAMLPSSQVVVINAHTGLTEPLDTFYKPTQRQEVWLSALEWCESGGSPTAINPKDLDGTPSLGAFQFKPSTFDLYSKKYGIKGELMDRDIQRLIVAQMLNDSSVKWRNQFPDCVRNKIGYPPISN